MIFYTGKWIEIDWKSPNDSPEDLCEIYVPPSSMRPAYFQGRESGTVYKLNRAYGTKYQWYMLDQRT